MFSTGTGAILPERIGAIEPYVYGLAKNLAQTNRVDLFGVGHGELHEGNLHVHTFEYSDKLPLTLEKIVGFRLAHHVPFNLYMLKNIMRLHYKDPVDVIHIHEVFAGFGASINKHILGIPYVCSVHNELRTTLPLKTCNKALAVSGYLRSTLIGSGRLDPNQVDILNVAIDVDSCKSSMDSEQAKRELGLHGKKLLLFVGRKCYEKGPHVLIRSLPQILENHPDAIAVLIGPDYYFGAKTSQFTELLISLAKKLGVFNNVVFKGHVSNVEKALYYNAANVFVCPSIWQDPSPTVIKEALAFGKAVVATNVGGTLDMITPDRSGIIVPPNDVATLSNAVIKLLNDPEYAKKLGLNGREVVEQKFSFKTVTQDCLEIYRQVIKK